MATPNLNITEVTESQNQKHITINDGLTKLDEATQDTITFTITGNTTVTATEYTENFAHILGGTPAGAFDFDVPATKRTFAVINNSGQTATVQVTGGGGANVAVANSENYILYCDGTDVLAIAGGAAGGGISGVAVEEEGSEVIATATRFDFKGIGVTAADDGGGQAGITIDAPYDLGMFYSGKPTSAQEIFRMEAVRGFTIEDGAPNSTGEARVASTGSVDFSIKRNGTQFATVTFNISASGTWAFDAAADEVFSAGDTLTIIAPATADATLEDIAIFIKGFRS
jgi:hypothetical protein